MFVPPFAFAGNSTCLEMGGMSQVFVPCKGKIPTNTGATCLDFGKNTLGYNSSRMCKLRVCRPSFSHLLVVPTCWKETAVGETSTDCFKFLLSAFQVKTLTCMLELSHQSRIISDLMLVFCVRIQMLQHIWLESWTRRKKHWPVCAMSWLIKTKIIIVIIISEMLFHIATLWLKNSIYIFSFFFQD